MSFRNESPEMVFLLKQKLPQSKEVINLVREYKHSKDEDEKERLRELIFNAHIRFIRKESCHFARIHPSIEVDDFFNAGVLGFMCGLDKFIIKRKVKFLTYVGFWIRNYMRICALEKNIVTIPRGSITSDGIHKHLVLKSLNASLTYLDEKIPMSEDGKINTYADIIPDPKTSFIEDDLFSKIDDEAVLERLYKIINNKLTIRERIIIREKFFKGKTNDATALIIGRTRERVRQELAKILAKIRLYMNSTVADIDVSINGRNNLGRIQREEQRANISVAKRNMSEATRRKSSKAQQKFSIELITKIKDMILNGDSYSEISIRTGVSKGTVGKIFTNQLLYAKESGLWFTEEEQKKVREMTFVKKIAQFKGGKNELELQNLEAHQSILRVA